MQGDDLLSLTLSTGNSYSFEPTKKRKRLDDSKNPNNNNLTILREMIKLGCNRQRIGDENGLQLIRLLLLCATSIDRNDWSSATELLRQLYRHSSLLGNPIQRLTSHFTDGLAERFMAQNSSPFPNNPSKSDQLSALASFYLASPYHQFAHFTANQAIVEAFERDERRDGGRIHVVDFDVAHGLQWPSLIQSLSDKANARKPVSLLLTGFGDSLDELRETGTRLSSFARGSQNLVFEFEGRLRGEKIEARRNATVAVNLVLYFQTLKNCSDVCSTLMQVKGLNPSVVTLVEKEGNRGDQTGGGFLTRFMESLRHFAAMFDSLDDCLPARNKERLRIEKDYFGREIRRLVVARDEEEECCGHERSESWKAVMERCGFEGLRMSSRSISQAKLLLKIKGHCCSELDGSGIRAGFRIFERDEGRALCLGWQDTHLITATAWRSSSSLMI